MDASSIPTSSQSNETQNQGPEVRIHQNPQAHHANTGEQSIERGPPPNWRTSINVDEKLTICRKYYLAGFFLLPVFWLVNFVWHYQDAYQAEPFDEQPEFKRYVTRSGIGFLVWAVFLTGWIVYFQTQRHCHDWDYLTFNFPTGSD